MGQKNENTRARLTSVNTDNMHSRLTAHGLRAGFLGGRSPVERRAPRRRFVWLVQRQRRDSSVSIYLSPTTGLNHVTKRRQLAAEPYTVQSIAAI